MNFQHKLNQIIEKNNSLVCVGLDPELEKLPKHLLSKKDPIFAFNKAIIDETADLVCAYKPNIAFYEAYGLDGLKQLKKTIDYLQKHYPDIPIILDAKRGDIANTAKMYAKAVFEYWRADAVTVYPHLGLDSLEPFLSYKEKLIILLIKTSNPDSGMFQDLSICHPELVPGSPEPSYLAMSQKISTWSFDNLGIFVGATYPRQLKELRELFPNHIFLSAGFGAQKGMIEQAVKAGVDRYGKGIMFNASRSILYASIGKDFAKKAREETEKLRDTINIYR